MRTAEFYKPLALNAWDLRKRGLKFREIQERMHLRSRERARALAARGRRYEEEFFQTGTISTSAKVVVKKQIAK